MWTIDHLMRLVMDVLSQLLYIIYLYYYIHAQTNITPQNVVFI